MTFSRSYWTLGLVETMGKSIVALTHPIKNHPGDILEQREDEILLEAIHRILILIATRTVSASGNYSISPYLMKM